MQSQDKVQVQVQHLDTSNSNTVNGVEFSSGYANLELAYDSGDIIYVEERSILLGHLIRQKT